MVDLKPGEIITVGHGTPAAEFNLALGETLTVTAVAAPPPPQPTKIAWDEINPVTDQVRGPVFSGDTVTKPFALRATLAGAASIRFSGAVSRTENNAPFAPFGDQSGNYAPANVAAGPLTIRAEAFSGTNASGTKLADETLTLTVSDGIIIDPPDPPDPPPTGGDKWVKIPANVQGWVVPPQGFKRTALDLFDTNVPQGVYGKPGGTWEFPKMTEGEWRWRPTAYANTGTDSSLRGHYSMKDTAWIEDHEMKEFIRYGKKDVVPFKHDPTGVPLVNRPLLVEPGATPSYTNISRRPAWCIDLYAAYPGGYIANFKCAHLMWGSAKINQPGYQEYDIPEFKFGDGLRGNAFFHNEGTVGGQDSVRLNIDTTQFHHYRLVFWAKGHKGHPTGYAEAWLDGKLVLRKTDNIGSGAVYYAKQTETYLKRDPLAPPTATGPQGIIRTRLFQISELT